MLEMILKNFKNTYLCILLNHIGIAILFHLNRFSIHTNVTMVL